MKTSKEALLKLLNIRGESPDINKKYLRSLFSEVGIPPRIIKQVDRMMSYVFAIVTINETVYWILMDPKNKNRMNDYELYKEYLEKFPSRDLYLYKADVLSNLSNVHTFNHRIKILEDRKQLLKAKKTKWDEKVKIFFEEKNRLDVVNLVEQKFHEYIYHPYECTNELRESMRFRWEEPSLKNISGSLN